IAGHSEQPFFQDRIAAVPERKCEAQPLMVVADAGDAVLAPAVGAQARVLEGKILPRGAPLAVVLANGSPGPFRYVGAPAAPVLLPASGFMQTPFLGFHEVLILAE